MRWHAVPDLSSNCREHPLHTRKHKHIKKHTYTVPSPQSANAEVTRQVAANKALRGQLQEKEDKLHQLQDKSVTHRSFSSLVLLFLFVLLFSHCSSCFLQILISRLLFVSLSPRVCQCVCTFSAALICSVWFHHVAVLCLLHYVQAFLSSVWIIWEIMHVLMSEWIKKKTTEGISVCVLICACGCLVCHV